MFPKLRRNKVQDDTRSGRSKGTLDSDGQEIEKPSAGEAQQQPWPLQHTSSARSALSSYHLSLRGNPNAGSAAKLRENSRDRRLDPLGLTVLHEPDADPVADIVFVHGLGGTSRQTWSKNRDPALFWPLEWLPFERTISSARISTFGYNAHFTSTSDTGSILNISHFAKDLLFQLRFAKGAAEKPLAVGTAPIIFVAHSMGGLVVKKAFILGQHDAHYKGIVQSTSAILFLSTPHRGTNLAELLNRVLSACLFGFSAKDYISELRTNSPTIQEINEQFRNLSPNIKIVSFFETKATKVGPSHVMILQPDSSVLGYPGEISEPLDSDHHDVCKFEKRQDSNYIKVRDILTYLIEEASPNKTLQMLPSAEEEMEAVTQLLGESDLPIDDLEFFSEKRLGGSCEWLLDQPNLRHWAESATSRPQILWCTGKPGSGKSVAASYLVSTLQDQTFSCAYYFFRFGDQVKNSLSLFLLTIAYQMASLIPEYRRRLFKMAEDGLNVQRAAPKLLWQKLFTSTLFKANIDKPLYVLVDGLDESESAASLLRLFLDLPEAAIPLRLLLVSRATQVISTGVDRLSKKLEVSHLSLDHADHDLRLYVSDEMQSMHGDDAFRGEITERILRKADGNFLWVHLVVSEILQCHTEDAVEDALSQVPQELEPLYERMDGALAVNTKPADQKLGRLVLMWACCSRYPLTLTELGGALQPDYPRLLDLKHTIQQVCGDFVVIDKKSHLTMMHSSARDFLIANESLNYYIQLDKSHQAIFTRCIGSMLSWNQKTRFEIASNSSFSLYAATSWPYHLSNSNSWDDQASLSLLARFFRNTSALGWISILASAGKLRILVDAGKALAAFLKASDRLDSERSPLTHRLQDKELLASWTHDLIRLVAKFGGQLTQHPKAIYSIVPAFCPQNAAIRTQLKHALQPGSISIRGQLNPNWDDCLAKFSIASESLPTKIITLERHFAIITADGVVRLHYSTTCEEARSFAHGERVLVTTFNSSGDKMATYGFLRTKVWDTRTARVLSVIENPQRTKATTLTFSGDGQYLLTLSDDRVIRVCTLDVPQDGWEALDEPVGTGLSSSSHVNSPKAAKFNQDATLLAVSYRGSHLSVWAIEDTGPVFLKQCERRSLRRSSAATMQTSATDAQAFCWNNMTGHILGIFNDGCVFKWHPVDDDYDMTTIRATNISCSSDGKFFVTGSGNGVLRIWDFYHFTPIYQLSYAASITDIAIDRNETRIYDIRERFCNVWEPNALYRLLDTDERASDALSMQESSTHISLFSEASVEDAEPITCLAATPEGRELYAVGDDGGRISVIDFDGIHIVDLSERFMTVDRVCWSADGKNIASADLSRSIMVEQLHGLAEESTKRTSTTFMSSESESIQQLLLNFDASRLFVALEKCLKLYSMEDGSVISTTPLHYQVYWIINPADPKILLGFGPASLLMTRWDDTLSVEHIPIETNRLQDSDDAPPTIDLRRRPSTSYPMSPTEVETTVERILLSSSNDLVLMEVSHSTFQGRRDTDRLILDISRMVAGTQPSKLLAKPLPSELAKCLEIPIGFVASHTSLAPPHDRRISMPQSPTKSFAAKYSPSKDSAVTNGNTLVFLSKDFWICTCDLNHLRNTTGPSDEEEISVKRYFFLPRDWVNMDLLQLATVTLGGQILCPRNGEVAVVENGLTEPWID
ncbi:hypothetical protein H2202_003854 [Exophiala xenobiotica]|nr:hypothetical protein H2202_003854 [Exophiala xenobiotica]KAK5238059.1 hypothetical protein LTR47_001152 [Exophiala xenobiotica]KAK5252014.1 hypothetical protein LTS06_003314 [Exophiala xenobiotica]KAK5355812.1 hypothetical protein LTR61_001485 [Exophiala xenobiotica]KAK5385292.1 hypothetical protein LTR11_001665 [Exophiala xenobiotica]